MPFNWRAASSDGPLADTALLYTAEPDWRRERLERRARFVLRALPGSLGELLCARSLLLRPRWSSSGGACPKGRTRPVYPVGASAASARFQASFQGMLAGSFTSLRRRPSRLIHTTPPHRERPVFLNLRPLVQVGLQGRAPCREISARFEFKTSATVLAAPGKKVQV